MSTEGQLPPGSWSPPPGGGGSSWPPAGGSGWPPGGAGGGPPQGSTPPGAQPPAAGRPRRRRLLALVAALVAALVLLGGLGLGFDLASGNLFGTPRSSVGTIQTPPQSSSSTGQSSQGLNAQAVANKVKSAVVDVNTVVQAADGSRSRAAGTGMVVTPSGEVLTNNHVVKGSVSISVTLAGSSTSHPARVLGVDPSADIALIQIEGVSGLPTVTLADSSSLRVGEAVVAIGNAGGQGGAPTVTQGSITALHQSITASDPQSGPEQLTDLIQTDAPIEAGDSGGPLVNAAGQVVGMITAGEAQSFAQASSSVGYAIPSSTLASIVNQIQAGHASSTVFIGETGYLGVGVQDLDSQAAAQLGLNVSSGALVVNVVSGSPAAKAGIQPGSVITQVDGTQITSAASLSPAIQGHKPGQSIRVTWVDQAGSHTASVTLTTGPTA
jgi:S1-C subfamily serine protease